MSFFRRQPSQPDRDELDADHDANVDDDLRLRTVRTAHSAIAESIRSEQRAERRKSRRRNFFRSKNTEKNRNTIGSFKSETKLSPAVPISGQRRNVYVNSPLTAMEVDQHGEPLARYVRNKVRTTSE